MRKIGAYVAIAAIAAVVCPPPAAAFGLRIGPFHIGLPFFWHRHHHLYMRGTPNGGDLARPETAHGVTSALLYPSLALPAIYDDIFSSGSPSPWPFAYQAILSTAFAKARPDRNPPLCQYHPDLATPIVARMRAAITPTEAQLQLLQRLGGALGAASGYLAKSCAKEIPSQPIARLQLMESQIEELAMALDIIRQPLQDFAQSLDDEQKARFAAMIATSAATDRNDRQGTVAPVCGPTPTAIDWSIDQIDKSVQPTDAQRDALADIKHAFAGAASDLDAHCPASWPPTASSRLELIEARLDSTWRAVLSIQVALGDFETKLSDQQKVRFDAMNFAAAR